MNYLETFNENKFKSLPSWVWKSVDELIPKEKRWEEVTQLLNRGDDIIDIKYWCAKERIEEYYPLKDELQKLEIELSQSVAKIVDSLVEWRDTTYPIENYYDGDHYTIPKEVEQIQNDVAYFCMDLTKPDWYKSAFSTPESVKRTLKARKEIMKKLEKDGFK